MHLKEKEWNESYRNKDNFVFYPHEEIIRFVSKYIKKRVGIKEFKSISKMKTCLDLGCGIGRHVIYLDEMGFESYGIDLSREAIEYSKEWVGSIQKEHLKEKLIEGSIIKMDFQDEFFDFIVSHGVLDSVNTEIAQQAMVESHRILKENGLFYFDVIAIETLDIQSEFQYEKVVETDHEKGTIQSYFNLDKIRMILGNKFEILDVIKISREDIKDNKVNCRYHIVVRKI